MPHVHVHQLLILSVYNTFVINQSTSDHETQLTGAPCRPPAAGIPPPRTTRPSAEFDRFRHLSARSYRRTKNDVRPSIYFALIPSPFSPTLLCAEQLGPRQPVYLGLGTPLWPYRQKSLPADPTPPPRRHNIILSSLPEPAVRRRQQILDHLRTSVAYVINLSWGGTVKASQPLITGLSPTDVLLDREYQLTPRGEGRDVPPPCLVCGVAACNTMDHNITPDT
ncbi:hypothetical protein J6590_018194 [Homalodisca vitripennis]|nr:hypothetical protein J6590_018194 [Homalodisca vitripennis]